MLWNSQFLQLGYSFLISLNLQQSLIFSCPHQYVVSMGRPHVSVLYMSFLSVQPVLWYYDCYHGIDFIHAISTQHRQKFHSLCNHNHTRFLWGIEMVNIISIFSRIPVCETVCGMLVPVLIAPNLYMQTDPMLWNGFWYNFMSTLQFLYFGFSSNCIVCCVILLLVLNWAWDYYFFIYYISFFTNFLSGLLFFLNCLVYEVSELHDTY